MAKKQASQLDLFAKSPFVFADRFLQDHAGQIISEPRTAILELIANSFDAGATQIDIIWPTAKGETFSVADNGIGMTKVEFQKRSRTLCYDRAAEQGNKVVFPKGVRDQADGLRAQRQRAVCPFCFADSYEVITTKEGECLHAQVGEPSWERLDDEGAYLDGRTEHAKKFSFIAQADFLVPGEDIKSDWSDFHANQRVNEVREAVHRYVIKEIQAQLATTRKERKKTAIENSRDLVGELPTISKRAIGQFIDEVQENCPTISDRDLSRTVQVLAKLEQSRSGYDLLAQLAACSPADLDTWNTLMQQWTASNAELVLNELDKRLKLVERLEKLVENPLSDELHDLQPVFERGLWIFGAEYEAVDFRSNRGLAEVIGKFLGGAKYKPPKRRPDFVSLPEISIGAYCADAYDAVGEISGIRKVAILELKKGGFCVTQKEADQARDYAKEVRQAGRVQAATEIVAYVLGAKLEPGLEQMTVGEKTMIIPMVYQTVLRKAHQRTFNLQKRLQEVQPTSSSDPEVEEVLRADKQADLFAGPVPPPHMSSDNGGVQSKKSTTSDESVSE